MHCNYRDGELLWDLISVQGSYSHSLKTFILYYKMQRQLLVDMQEILIFIYLFIFLLRQRNSDMFFLLFCFFTCP